MGRGGKRIGSGRPRLPKNERRVLLTTRIHPSGLSILKELAKRKKTGIGDVIEMALITLYDIVDRDA